MKLFVSGSISFSALPTDFKAMLDKAMLAGMDILVGDANGVDTLVQRYLASHCYKRVTVYTIHTKPRSYMSADFKIKQITPTLMNVPYGVKQTQKDIAMCEDCDAGVTLWDGVSKGTRRNMHHLKRLNKLWS